MSFSGASRIKPEVKKEMVELYVQKLWPVERIAKKFRISVNCARMRFFMWGVSRKDTLLGAALLERQAKRFNEVGKESVKHPPRVEVQVPVKTFANQPREWREAMIGIYGKNPPPWPKESRHRGIFDGEEFGGGLEEIL